MRQIPSDWANEQGGQVGETDTSWALLVQTAAYRRVTELPEHDLGFWLDQRAQLANCQADDPRAQLVWHANGLFLPGPSLAPEQREFVRLYLPLLSARPDKPVVVAHLGQSIDAKIATNAGDSYYVTGHENLRHLHRMRALCDAVIVGAGTVFADNPRLTTRLVEGPNPVRVVIDPARRLDLSHSVFADQEAQTLRVCTQSTTAVRGSDDQNVIAIASNNGELALDDVVRVLGRRGLRALFVEGGGITVSRWIDAGLVDRLQIATAPILVGAGRPALTLPAAVSMQACVRPDYRLYQMGNDVLWDLDLRTAKPQGGESPTGLRRLA